MSIPKVILFDIGGVCVSSPFQAIIDYESRLGIPIGWINHCISKSAPYGYWQRLETGSIPLDEDFFAGFTRDLHNPERWAAFCRQRQMHQDVSLPQIDGKRLFTAMIQASTHPDPHIVPALLTLRADGRFLLGALSNTIIFPSDHPLHASNLGMSRFSPSSAAKDSVFDTFVSSAHVGLRKPDPRIYALALARVNEFARANAASQRGVAQGWSRGIEPQDVVFLDDIGENLKAARKFGFRTIKVPLGRSSEAVVELEAITELKLAGHGTKKEYAKM